jgi:acetylornithine/succinyldiaminopimelate/putrescine aminotransferase
MSSDYHTQNYRPLLPDIRHLRFNNIADLQHITERTAAVIVEPIQAEAGVIAPQNNFLQHLRARCLETGTLLILDEIQTGYGRTGTLFAFEQLGIVPDILLLAKGFGGGLPLGAFVANKRIMSVLSHNPVLGHITTFGGNAVCCAASLATLKVLLTEDYISQVKTKEQLFRHLLVHPAIKSVRSFGLLMAVEFANFELNKRIIDRCIEKGVITDWFLFADNCMRIAPPLIITEPQIEYACRTILEAIDEVLSN